MALVAGLLILLSGCGRAPARPSLLLVIVEGLRADHASAYGYARRTTPGLEALAGEGALFERAFTSSPDTRTAIGALLSGRYPPEHGLLLRAELASSVRTLPEILSEEGYRTHVICSDRAINRKSGLLRGIASAEPVDPAVTPEPDGGAAEVTRRAVRWLEESAGAAEPFFLTLIYSSMNLPYNPPPPYRTRFLPEDENPRRVGEIAEIWSPFAQRYSAGLEELGAHDLAILTGLYDGEVAYADALLSDVMAALADAGGDERTLVVITSERGEDLGELHRLADSSSLWEANLHVPLLMRLPGRIPRGLRVEGFFQDIDLVPTLCDLMGLPAPSTVTETAVSHVPLDGEPRRATAVSVALRRMPEGVFDLIMSVRDARHRYQLSPQGPEALHDLQSGTEAATNVIGSSPEEVRRLHLALQEWDASLQPLPGASETPATLPASPPAAAPGAAGDPSGEPAP